MKIIVTHAMPDLDAITSVWLLRKFLPAWENAKVMFVPAGQRIQRLSSSSSSHPELVSGSNLNPMTYNLNPIEQIGEDEVIHVDTGMGPLDHHQTNDQKVCAASKVWDYVRSQNKEFAIDSEKWKERKEAIARIVGVVIEDDHFLEVFYSDATADYQEFSLTSILNGLKLQKPNEDEYYVDFISLSLDAILHAFENRIWAEREIKNNGIKFQTKWGKGIGFKTINDDVVKLSQKMGYMIVVRKDPRKGYVRIKARPTQRLASSLKNEKLNAERYTLNADIDLTLVYEQLSKMDPEATWFLHVSKKMLLNGTPKNPKMIPTKLSLEEIIKVLEKI